MKSMTPNKVQHWLDKHCTSSQHIVGGVVLSTDAACQEFSTIARWPAEGPLTPSLVATAQKTCQNPEPRVYVPAISPPNAKHTHLISLPLRSGEEILGALALAVNAPDDDYVQGVKHDLERSSAMLASFLASMAPLSQSGDAAKVLHLQTILFNQPQLVDAASDFANELAVMLGFDRVSVGMLERGRISLAAVSNSVEFKSEQALLRAITGAMEEAVDQCATLTYPALPGEKPRIVLAHADLAAQAGSTLCTVPLISANQPIGALVFERSGNAPLTVDEVNLCEHVACLTGPLLDLKRRAGQSLIERHMEAWRNLWAHLASRERHKPKFVAGGVLVAAALFLLVPVTYHVGAPARIEGAVQRIIAAPVDGFLGQAHVRPGDAVRAGDILVELLNQDLLLEQRKWESELAQHENSYSSALTRADRVQFVNNQAKANQARAQLDLVQLQLDRSRIASPMDGVVIKGDLSQSLGAPVKQGEELLMLAPANAFRLVIEVDERDIRAVHPGQQGYLALSALPVDTLGFTVGRVIPVAVTVEGRNVFLVEGNLESGETLLRPGLQGVAKIKAGERSLAWIMSHRIINWLRIALWSWGA